MLAFEFTKYHGRANFEGELIENIIKYQGEKEWGSICLIFSSEEKNNMFLFCFAVSSIFLFYELFKPLNSELQTN